MHETPDDLAMLQAVLDESYAAAGPHLLEISAPERRLDAAGVARALNGMKLLVLATSTADGRPIAGPVDGIFYRGRFHFGSSPESVRFRHIKARPAVSATHLPGEHLAITVHGDAEIIDVRAPEHAGFLETLLGYYVPRYGEAWAQMLDQGALYARINPRRMFTFWMSQEELAHYPEP